LQGGGEWALASLFDPADPACGEALYLPYYYFVVDHPRGLVVIDCGVHPELAADPAGRLGRSTGLPDIRMSPEDDLAAQLGRVGATPADVEHVVLTHLHYDHCGGLSAMPAATIHLQRAELDFAENPPVYQRDAYVRADWADVANWALHDGGHDLFGDDSIAMLPTPGHTPGHQSVLVRLPDRVVILAGDAIYHPGKTAERRLPGYLWNPDKLVASWELIESLAALHAAEVQLSHYPAVAAALSGAAAPPPRSHG
jgi:glyoxylase-like metal-dependent hydrolase (beta-lactamase superfamily II)